MFSPGQSATTDDATRISLSCVMIGSERMCDEAHVSRHLHLTPLLSRCLKMPIMRYSRVLTTRGIIHSCEMRRCLPLLTSWEVRSGNQGSSHSGWSSRFNTRLRNSPESSANSAPKTRSHSQPGFANSPKCSLYERSSADSPALASLHLVDLLEGALVLAAFPGVSDGLVASVANERDRSDAQHDADVSPLRNCPQAAQGGVRALRKSQMISAF